ncbi:RHS repeat domain-containing protein [Tenacibaculum maritimum]|uniref:RHS repeat domain-containing protein n=1 Tax=Tenacibaculum maritimum TaxID=107401 RepID=UPI001330A989|nr:RHS repeat-associated core domain-containing protein [Tenacibaculum maritimum]
MDYLVIHRDSGIAIGKKEEDLYTQNYSTKVGAKRYELANHLGNVINIVSDRKIIDDKGANLYDTPSGKTNLSFNPEIIGYNDYYPFGMLVPNRHGQADSYRYGFNGMEKDDELKGEGNSYDFGARMHDPRIGRWFAVDPLRNKAPGITPYRFGLNNPIKYLDPDGKWEEDGHFWTVYAFGIMTGLDKTTARMLAVMAEFYDHDVHDDLSMSMTPAAGMDALVWGKDGGLGTWAWEAYQEDLHGLTGGPQSDVLSKAIDFVLLDNTFMQLHTVGDAWAHSYSDDASGKRMMFGAEKITVPLLGRITFQHAFIDEHGNKRDGPDTTDRIESRPIAYRGYIGSLDKIYQSLNFAFASQVKNSTNFEMFDYIQKQGGNKEDNIFLMKSYIDHKTGERDSWITTKERSKKLTGLFDLLGVEYTTSKSTVNIKGKNTEVHGIFTKDRGVKHTTPRNFEDH